MPDFIPAEDAEFDSWYRDQFLPYLNANFAALGLTAAENTAAQAKGVSWGYAYPGSINASAAARAANETKDLQRADSEANARFVSNKVQANPAATAAMKEGLGITVRKTSRTAAPVPSSTPTLPRIDTSTRGILRLFFYDSATPDSRKKPPGVSFCEIREQIGGAEPTDPNAMPFLASETRSPYRADYEPDEVGQTVYFAMRWVNTRGEPGPWSQNEKRKT